MVTSNLKTHCTRLSITNLNRKMTNRISHLPYNSKTALRHQLLIVIMNLIAKLGIIYTSACHAGLCTTVSDFLSVSCHCCCTALTTIYKHDTGGGDGD